MIPLRVHSRALAQSSLLTLRVRRFHLDPSVSHPVSSSGNTVIQ